MHNITAAVLLDLVATKSADAEDRIEKIMEWSFSHSIESSKLILGTAFSILASLLIAYLKGDLSKAPVTSVAAGVGCMTAVLGGLYNFIKLRRIDLEYIYVLNLLETVKTAGSVIKALPTVSKYI